MASEVIKLNLIPKGEMPVFHASQFDTGRLITCELYRGEDAYSVPEGYTVELHCRKVDNNIVTMASTLINDNVVTFTSTEQLTACNGKNLCEVAILDDGYRIGTLNFILEVEIDPLKGGITSTSEIHNLETQIEEITTEIVGENYYNKSELDTKLALKANAADVYTKSETDTKLALKANAADVYTKQEVDNIILDIMPVDTASGAIATFDTELATPLVNVKCDITATGGNGTPDNPVPINGYTEANITANGDTVTIAFGQTVYGGVLDVTRGKLHVTHEIIDLGSLSWIYSSGTYSRFYSSGIANLVKAPETADTIPNMVASSYEVTSFRVAYQQQINNVIAITEASSGSHGNINVVDNNYSDAVVFKTAVSGQTLAYELATPFDIDLTPEVISAIVGVNNVYSDTNGDTTVKFKDTIQNYIDKKVSI